MNRGVSIVYLNGEFLPADQAKVSVFDRGFLFGDGVYEVIPVFGGRLFRRDEHLHRLDRSLAAIRLANPLTGAQWAAILDQVVQRNGAGDQGIYLQVTRGVGPRREHPFPPQVTPTLLVMSLPLPPVAPELLRDGIGAITVADVRWLRCNVKAITLLSNVLATQEALDAGAAEAILVRDGDAIEGAASNLFVVHQGTVITPPQSHLLLPGITRDVVLELCRAHGIPCTERPIALADLHRAQEIWITSSNREVLAVTTLDGAAVGDGRPGPVWQRVLQLYRELKEAVRAGRAE